MNPNDKIIEFLAHPDNLETALDLVERYNQRLITSKDKMTDFLSRPINLPTIRKISENMDQVKGELIKAFWLSLADNMRDKLERSQNQKRWQLWIEPEERLYHPWTGLTLWPLNSSPHQLLTVITLLQPEQMHINPLYYGIRWAPADEPNGGGRLTRMPDLVGLIKLKSKLLEMGFRTTDPHWLQYRLTEYKPASNNFLLRIATNKGELAEEIAQLIWDFLEEIEPYLQEANRDSVGLNARKLLRRP